MLGVKYIFLKAYNFVPLIKYERFDFLKTPYSQPWFLSSSEDSLVFTVQSVFNIPTNYLSFINLLKNISSIRTTRGFY